MFLAMLVAGVIGQTSMEHWAHGRSDQERARVGSDALVLDAGLCAVAHAHAARIAGGWRDPRFGSMHSAEVLGGRAVYREVVAVTGTGDPVTNWCSLPSVGHREVVLGRGWRRCGFGHARDARGWNYWVGLYAR